VKSEKYTSKVINLTEEVVRPLGPLPNLPRAKLNSNTNLGSTQNHSLSSFDLLLLPMTQMHTGKPTLPITPHAFKMPLRFILLKLLRLSSHYPAFQSLSRIPELSRDDPSCPKAAETLNLPAQEPTGDL
jgi:hypothetical protein